jgi:hypothetical protein
MVMILFQKRCSIFPAGGLGVYTSYRSPPRLGIRGLIETISAVSGYIRD